MFGKRYIKLGLLVFICLITTYPKLCLAGGNTENYTQGAAQMGMGYTNATQTDVFSAFNNQAGLAHLQTWSVGVFTESRYLLNELSYFGASAALPTKQGAFGLSVGYFGSPIYNENKIGLAYGRMLGERFSIGTQLQYLGVAIEEYGSKGALTFELGMQFNVTNDFTLAAHVFNPVRIELSEYQNEQFPTVFKLGFGWKPSDKLTINAETEKDIDYDVVFKAGIEYKIIDALALRAGVGTAPTLGAFGVGIYLKENFQIDVAAAYHQQLGFTPGISFIYKGKSESK